MKARVTSFIVVLLFTTGSMHAQSIWDAEHLKTVKQSIQEQPYSDIFQELKSRADKLLNAVPYSVMDKEKTPASGDKHDYMSRALLLARSDKARRLTIHQPRRRIKS